MSLLKGPVVPGLLAVGVAVGSVGGVYALLSHHRAKAAPPPPLRNAAWTVAGSADAPVASELAGVWVTGDVVVRAGLDGLHAVRRADGATAWDLPVPAREGAVCALSAAAGAGIGVFSYREEASGKVCEAFAAVDLGTGKVLWSGRDAGVQEVALDSGVAVIEGLTAGVTGRDARTGAVRWKADANEICNDGPGMLVADHGRVATVWDCKAPDVTILDVKTGAKVAKTRPGFSAPHLGGVTADPLIVADSFLRTTALSFGSTQVRLPASLTGMFPLVGDQIVTRAEVSVGGGVLCIGGPAADCFTTAGRAIALRPLPGALQSSPHDVIAVDTLAGDAARVLTIPNAAQPRATLCRVSADGTYVAEAELSLPVSKFLGADGAMTYPVFAYSDAKDLILVAQRPGGQSAVVDVRLTG